ncbi:MAG: right-handed parallel beta-helix repeat-containing protein [Methanobacteriota archaeon]
MNRLLAAVLGLMMVASAVVVIIPSSEAANAETSAMVDPSLVAEWKFNEGAGTVAYDTSGNGNDGTLMKGPAWVPGISENGLEFDGLNDYVNVSHNPALNIGGAGAGFTAEAWIKLNNPATSFMQIMRKRDPSGTGYEFQIRDTGNNLTFRSYNAGVSASASVSANDGRWHHVSATKNATDELLRLYFDGMLVNTSSSSTPGTEGCTETLNIGCEFGTAAFFNGSIDEVRIWSRALNATEIWESYTRFSMTPHLPIRIDSDGDFDAGHGVVNWATGNGTVWNPWTIENWDINGTGAGCCIYIGNTTEYFVISNCSLYNASGGLDVFRPNSGVDLYNLQNGRISNLALHNQTHGITLYYSDNNEISDVTSRDTGSGAYFLTSRLNTVRDSAMGNALQGLVLNSQSDRNRIINCTFANNTGNGVFLQDSEWNNITKCTLSNNDGCGLETTANSDRNTVTNCNISYNDRGIHMNGITASWIVSNDIHNNVQDGIWLETTSWINITDNTFDVNGQSGVLLLPSSYATIADNTFTGNAMGVHLSSGTENQVRNNTISDSTNTGIYIGSSDYNLIYNNNLIDNVAQGMDNQLNNDWSAPYPRGGNYWNDYAGLDAMWGVDQDLPGKDGLGDAPYDVDGNTQDRYPLIHAFGSVSIAHIRMNTGAGNSGENLTDTVADVGFSGDVFASAYDANWTYLFDANVTWSLQNFSGASASLTGAWGLNNTLSSGAATGYAHMTVVYAPGINYTINITINRYFPDLSIDGVGGNIFQDPPGPEQTMTRGIGINGARSYSASATNNGTAPDRFTLMWVTTGLNGGWNATLYCHWNGTTIDANFGTIVLDLGNLNPGQSANFSMNVTSPANASWGDMRSVGLGLFGGNATNHDSFGVTSQIWTPDAIQIVHPSNGTEIGTVYVDGGQAVMARAIASNVTGGDLGPISVAWSVAPVLGTFDNATGPNSTFTAGYTGGWTIVTGTDSTWGSDSFTVFITGDSTAPSSGCDVTGAYWRTTTPITLTATAIDASPSSGIANVELFYRYGAINGTWTVPWTSAGIDNAALWSWPFNFPDGQGFYEFYTIATDKLGQTEAAQAVADLRHGFDSDAPATTISIGTPKNGTATVYVNRSTPFNLTATTDLSGVAAIKYRIWDGGWSGLNIYTGNFTLEDQIGIAYIEYFSIDLAGNQEAPNNVTVWPDEEPPVVTLTITAPRFGLNPVCIMPSTVFNLTATDAGSGVAGMWYRIDSGAWVAYSGNFALTASGAHNISVMASDNIGQNSTLDTFYVFVDTIVPVTSVEIGAPSYGTAPVYISSSTQINLTANDSGAGVDLIRFRVYRDSTGTWTSWATYSGPLNFSTAGAYAIEYRALDNLGNTEAIKKLDIIVDLSAPAIDATVGSPKYGNAPTYITTATSLTLAASDSGSGVAEMRYSVDAGAWTAYSVALTFATEGAHAIRYYAADNLGHESAESTIEIFVDVTPPTASMSPTPTGGAIVLHAGENVTLMAIDADVGGATIFYSLDGGTTWSQYTAPLVFDADATLMFYAEDALGNRAATHTVSIDVTGGGVGGGGFGDYWWIIIIVLMAAMALIYVMIRKKGKDAGQDAEEDPKAPDEMAEDVSGDSPDPGKGENSPGP